VRQSKLHRIGSENKTTTKKGKRVKRKKEITGSSGLKSGGKDERDVVNPR